jgi:hypothetical protein
MREHRGGRPETGVRQREHFPGWQKRHGIQVIVSGNHLGGYSLGVIFPFKSKGATTGI